MMFSPLQTDSSLNKLLTVYLDVIIVCNIIKAEQLHLCGLIFWGGWGWVGYDIVILNVSNEMTGGHMNTNKLI